jgi:hypothetical protein
MPYRTSLDEVGNNFQEIGRTLLTFSVERVRYDSIRYNTGIVRPAGGHNQNLWKPASHHRQQLESRHLRHVQVRK